MSIEKPNPEDFGYEPRGLENEGGWTQQGGEEAYFKALHEWEMKNSIPTTAPQQNNDVKEVDIEKVKNQAYQEGFEKGVETTIHLTRHSQPYEITSDVSVKYSAKGEMQPEAAVKITRYLEDGDSIAEIIRADLARGVEEMMVAIANIRNGGVMKP